MGLLDIFSKEGRTKSARDKNIQRAVNKYAQSADRWKALESLRDDGTDDALYGLLRRFGMMYDKTIEDEQEKEFVFEVLLSKGANAIPAIERYLASADSISWPLRILDKVADRERELAVIKKVLERHEPGYERDPTKKQQLLSHLGSLQHVEAAALCAPYLVDMDEGVRFTAVEALLAQKNGDVAVGPLCDQFVSAEEDSLRIRLRMAEGFVEHGWTVPADKRAGLQAQLPEAFVLEKDGRLKKKA
jgi:hypothetical protein